MLLRWYNHYGFGIVCSCILSFFFGIPAPILCEFLRVPFRPSVMLTLTNDAFLSLSSCDLLSIPDRWAISTLRTPHRSHALIHAIVHPLIHSLIHSLIRSLIHPFTHPWIHPWIAPFTILLGVCYTLCPSSSRPHFSESSRPPLYLPFISSHSFVHPFLHAFFASILSFHLSIVSSIPLCVPSSILHESSVEHYLSERSPRGARKASSYGDGPFKVSWRAING